MKRFYFFLLLLINITATAQIINFPDQVLKARLLSASTSNTIASTESAVNQSGTYFWTVTNYYKIDSNNDGQIQVSEAQAIKYLDINSADFTSVSQKITNLSGLENFTNLEVLNCGQNNLTTLNATVFPQLRYLYCAVQQINSLNVVGLTNLKGMQCVSNPLGTLNLTGCTSLEMVNCAGNQLTTLDLSGYPSLKDIICSNNQMTSLNVTNLSNLKTLNCNINQLTSLNLTGFSNLVKLDCSQNNISSLNVSNLPALNDLQCYSNNMLTLNATGCANLFNIVCRNNALTSLQIGGCTSLSVLHCYVNQLPELDLTGLTNLSYLRCQSNNIASLDLSQHPNMRGLYCGGNPNMTILNIKNNNQTIPSSSIMGTSWSDLDFSGNYNLRYICADEADFALVQNRITSYNLINCHFNSYCSFTPNGVFYEIAGIATFDGNNDGCGQGDNAFANLKFNITNGTNSGAFIANESGNYYIPVMAGNYTVTPVLENPTYYIASPSFINVSFPTQTSPFTQNFCILPNGVRHDFEVVIIPLNPARPGFDARYKIKYRNKGNQNGNATINFSYDDLIMDFVSSDVVPNTQGSGALSWTLSTLAPLQWGEIELVFNLNSQTETPPVNSNDILSYTATLTTPNTDLTPLDNTMTLNQLVVNSLDPNDKTCLEGQIISPTMIGQYVHYMIRFENTGTFAAENIVVKDIIDAAKFDLSTLRITDTSHSCYTNVTNPNKVEFIFENINLPFNDANNDGYVVFKIKTKTTLTVGSQITNSANIYFDYNYPIVTNTATSTFQILENNAFEQQNNILVLSPNPAKDVLYIRTIQNTFVSSLSIYNTLGQIVQTIINPSGTMDISGLKTGNYIVKIITDKGVSSQKLIKE